MRLKVRWMLLAVAAVAFVAIGLSRISFNVDILKLLPTHLPQVEGLSLFLKHFAQPNELIVTIEAATPEAADEAATTLAARFEKETSLVKRAVARAPWESNPAELAELLAFLVLNQPPEKIREVIARLAPERTAATLQETLEKLTDSISPQEVALLSYDPYDLAGSLADSGLMSGAQQSEFSSADGTFRVIYLEAAQPFANYTANIAWMREIKRVAADAKLPAGVQLGFTGEPAFVADISGSMEWDMRSSGFVTLLVIAVIFWVCYRRLRPLRDLQAMLVLIFLLTLATAGIFLSELTVIGVGCAAIMIGLSVDYGYFVYQRSLGHRGTVRELQKLCVQNIAWTATSTAAVFFSLNLSSLPGLSQLGNLVGIGVIIGALVMLTIFAPLTLRFHHEESHRPPSVIERLFESPAFLRAGAWVSVAMVLLCAGALLVKGLPAMDFSARTLRPRVSEAYTALDRLQARLISDRDLLSLVVSGRDESEVLARLRAADAKLAAAKARGEVASFRTALPVWPVVENQRANLAELSPLADQTPRLRQAAIDAGFKEEAFALTDAMFAHWSNWRKQIESAAASYPIWPANETSRWIFRRVAAGGNGSFLAMGMVQPVPGHEDALTADLQSDGTWLVSWGQLGRELKRVIPAEFFRVIIALAAIFLVIVSIGFRSVRAVALFVVTTGLVLLCLAGAMSLFGMTWNFFNLAALLLLLGTGTDYSILLMLALQRNGGNAPAAQRELSLVICLCVSSAAAGFGTISWANHAGLAALGLTCALGLLIDALISLFLLPHAWAMLHRRS
jgi:predicted RND superfamily exporter protein